MGECALHDSAKHLLSDINSTNSTDGDLFLEIDILSKNCSHDPCACSNNLRSCKSLANGSGPFIFNILFHLQMYNPVSRRRHSSGETSLPANKKSWNELATPTLFRFVGRKKKKIKRITQLRYQCSVQSYR